jgi:DNA polymerase III subunit epsilon
MKALIYDTETTGLPLFSEASNDSRQPHIVQLGAQLVDLDTERVHAGIDLVIKPDGYTIPAEVAKIHGITTEHALDVGVPAHYALFVFFEMWRLAQVRIAHNEQFDARILRIACARHGDLYGIPKPDEWRNGRAECTQILSTPILKLPPTERMLAAGRNHHKSANLREAYLHFTGRELVDAHSAMADTQACAAVYFAIKKMTTARPAAAAGVHR